MIAEVDLTDPGSGVEEEREPAYPGPELHPTDGLDAVREVERRFKNVCYQLYRAPPSVSISKILGQRRWKMADTWAPTFS